MKKEEFLAAVMLALSNSTFAQSYTYNHDAPVYNQFLVGENGAGSLSPSEYYDLFHRNYQSWACASNKNGLRAGMTLALNPEVAMAQELDSALTYRARIETMNVADRLPTAFDLAWQSERAKIKKKFKLFRENINMITMKGGSSRDYRDWLEVYNCLQTALKAVRDAYMPLNERKKEYLSIYHDLVLRNHQLVQYLYAVSCGKYAVEMLKSGEEPRHASVGSLASDAFGRWKVAMAAGVVSINH